ncbi:MAG: putative DNA modification/repair radical SAM protein [Clostridiales bacterium]|jgi:putative DNA modification/repair radical SAM protein|nr:putative DNA modification/repair radical SAM protein [Eubacteriales bacterium]MDH7565201.1 putative DNA modification/repair radical SAM protein [Clostridiales bacterium]
MELEKKLNILADSAKYDASCSSSGSTRKNKPGGVGNGSLGGICHSFSDDGRCISLFKILLTNHCIFDCKYCVNRASNDIPRTFFTPDEITALTLGFYRRNYIEGLFLSSAIYKNPDYTMELLLTTVRKLRKDNRFNGYIHLKAIPGADPRLIREAGYYADRMSVNIELPTQNSLKLLAPQKSKDAIIKPMSVISSKILENRDERKHYSSSPAYVPAGQSTQMVIGATPDTDLTIMTLSENLYKRFRLKRVYYSAYVPVSSHPALPGNIVPPLLREHRLYQADWLLRFYGFKAEELLNADNPNLDMELDPKSDWAVRNLHLFPVEVNSADYSMLLRVPGIGVHSAHRIVAARRHHSLDYGSLKKIGVVLKRACLFITCRGKYYGNISMNEALIKDSLASAGEKSKDKNPQWQQLSLFPSPDRPVPAQVLLPSITGEL